MNRILKMLAPLAVLTTGAALSAQTPPAPKNDALAIPKTAISLSQAVGVAEQHVHGRATRAELEQTRHGPAYDVEVVTASSAVFDVAVDAASGKVLSSKVDAEDHDDAADKPD